MLLCISTILIVYQSNAEKIIGAKYTTYVVAKRKPEFFTLTEI